MDRVLVGRITQAALHCRGLKGSFSRSFRLHFAERLLPELCFRLERARRLAGSSATFREAAGAYQGLLLGSQVLQLTVAVMNMAENADLAGQPSGQIEQILDAFARQMWPLFEAGLSEDPGRIHHAIADHGAAYGAWISYLEQWSAQVQTAVQQVHVAKFVWDAAMMVTAAHEAATGVAGLVASGRPPIGPWFIASGTGAAAVPPAAYVQLAEALRRLIAQGALDAAVIAGLGRMIQPSAGGSAAAGLPDPTLPVAFAMGQRNIPANMIKVRKINGRYPLNAEYAGRTYDKLPDDLRAKYSKGVRFDEEGFPDFRPYAVKEVQIEMTGERAVDFARANKVAGFERTPREYVWHHHQDCRTMQLVPKDLHDAVRHSGGVSILKGDF